MSIYIVREGDSVDSIGNAFAVSPYLVAWANQIEPPYQLAVGQSLFIPDGTVGWTGGQFPAGIGTGMGVEIETEAGSGTTGWRGQYPVRLGGYAYPWIEAEILDEITESLSSISVFSYGFTEAGELVPPQAAGEARILAAAREKGVTAALVLTPLGADGHFNNHLVSVLVQDLDVQQRVIRAVWQEVQDKGYGEVNVDFEYVLAEDREALAAFVGRLKRILNLYGILVTVALAPKTSANQPGLLYEGIDYGLLGQAANRVFLMTYEWGYTYGPPMAVAPLNMVRRVVEYAVTEIPREKILLGIPNYGYDWPLPYERGVTKAQSLGYTDAIALAIDHGVPIQFDPTAQSPFFRYWQYGILHEVWFEDVRSLQAKFRLLKEFGLAGAGYWQLMRLFRASWLLAREEFDLVR